MKTKVCVICGEEFTPANSRQKMCDKEHYHKCPNCGKPVLTKVPSDINKCCSRKCGQAIAQKKRDRNFESKSVKKHVFTKTCAYCGKQFQTTSSRQKYCGDDYYDCPVCGKKVKVSKDRKNLGVACSEKCRLERIRQTNQSKYGVDCVFQSEDVKSKSKETLKQNYGVEHPFQSSEIRSRAAKTNLKKYGTAHPLQNDKVKAKQRETNVERYGGNSPMCSPDVKAKTKETVNKKYGGFTLESKKLRNKYEHTMESKYGGIGNQSSVLADKIANTNKAKYGFENPMKNKDVKAAAKKTNMSKYGSSTFVQSDLGKEVVKKTLLEKYGVENAFQSEIVKEKSRETLVSRYGVDNPMKSNAVRQKARQTSLERYGSESWLSSIDRYVLTSNDKIKSEEWVKFKKNPKIYLESLQLEQRSISSLCERFGVTATPIYMILHKNNLGHLIYRNWSGIEDEVYQFVKSTVSSSVTILRNNRTVIHPQELDIYLPSLKFAIEVNPAYTHNSSLPSFGAEHPKSSSYHANKTKMCKEQGVTLFHLWDYDWNEKREIVKSMISSRLNCTKAKVFARNTIVKEVPFKDASSFLNSNHLLGTCVSKTRLGLYSNDNELLSIMTFGRLRRTQGDNGEDKTIELSRFCSKLNTEVIGGASKLFKHACKAFREFSFSKIVSFSDVATTTGNLYKTLGFEKVSQSEPRYTWVKLSTGQPVNRVSAQKRNLKKLLNDDSIDLTKTERQIMIEHGYVQVYDCGVIRWEFEL